MDSYVDIVPDAESCRIFASDGDEILESVPEFYLLKCRVPSVQDLFDIAAGHAGFYLIGVRAQNGLILEVALCSLVHLPRVTDHPGQCDDENDADDDISRFHVCLGV